MAFDIIGARNAGYSEAEIADHLGQLSGFDTTAARKAGYRDNEILAHLSSAWARQDLPAGVTPSSAGGGRGSVVPKPEPTLLQKGLNFARTVKDSVVSSLPGASIPSAERAATLLETPSSEPPSGPSLIEQRGAPVSQEYFDAARAGLSVAKPSDRARAETARGFRGSVAGTANRDIAAANAGTETVRGLSGGVEARADKFIRQGASADTASAKAKAEIVSGTASPMQTAGVSYDEALSDAIVRRAGDIGLSAAKIPPTVLKGFADMAQLATAGTVGADASGALDKTNQWIDSQKSTGAQIKAAEFARHSQNGTGATAFNFLLDNPGFLMEQAIPSLGSMALPVGASAAAGRIAAASKWLKALPAAEQAAALEKIREAVTLGTTVAQNSADTFADTKGTAADRYKAAGIAAAGTLLAGKAFDGGAEKLVTRALSGAGRSGEGLLSSTAKAVGKEGGQEFTEAVSQNVGQQVGETGQVDPRAAIRQGVIEGTIGAFVGGGVSIATHRAAIDQTAADHGIPPKAAARIKDQAEALPPEQRAGFVRRAFDALERRGLAKKPGAGTAFEAAQATPAAPGQPANTPEVVSRPAAPTAADLGWATDDTAPGATAAPVPAAPPADVTAPSMSAPPEPTAQPGAASAPVPMWQGQPIEPAGQPLAGPDGRQYQPVMLAGKPQFVPVDEITTSQEQPSADGAVRELPVAAERDAAPGDQPARGAEDAGAGGLQRDGGLGADASGPALGLRPDPVVRDGSQPDAALTTENATNVPTPQDLGTQSRTPQSPQGAPLASGAQPVGAEAGLTDQFTPRERQGGTPSEGAGGSQPMPVAPATDSRPAVGLSFEMDGQRWTVTGHGKKTVSIANEAGRVRAVAPDSQTWKKMTQALPVQQTAQNPEQGPEQQPAPTRKPKVRSHPQAVRGSTALAAISRSLGGLSPDLLADLSQKTQRTRVARSGRKSVYTQWDNPAIPGVGPLFRNGGTADLSLVAQSLEDAGYLAPGTVARDPIAAQQQAQEIVRAELAQGGQTLQAGNPDAVEAEARQRADAAMDDARDPWQDFDFMPDDLEFSGFEDVSAEVQAAVMAITAEAEAAGIDIEAIRDEVARQIGEEAPQHEYEAAVQQSLADALAEARRPAQQAQSERPSEGVSGGRQAAEPPSASRGDRPDGPDSAVRPEQEGLTLEAQTAADLQSKTEREAAGTKAEAAKRAAEQERLRKAAEAKDVRDRADSTVDDFRLGQAADEQLSGMGDMFADSGRAPRFSRASKPKTIAVDGVDRPTTNSKGQPIAATDEALRNFWRWFGDSKVVDGKGNPLVMYHGTTSTDISEFMPHGGRADEARKALSDFLSLKESGGRFAYGRFRAGSFFSPDPEYAGNYTGNSGVMYPVYIKAESPTVLDMRTKRAARQGKGGTTDALISMAGGEIAELAIMDPAQVKSATGNSGEFDPGSPDIRYSRSKKPAGERNLIVAHNLSADNLRNALEIGGLPAPSLAVTKVDAPIQGFGEITLIGDTKLATPSAKNPVFDADVYSPRFPDVKVKVDEKAVARVLQPLADAAQKAGLAARGGDSAIDGMSRNRLATAAGDLSYDVGMRLGYANAVLGKSLTAPTKTVAPPPTSKAGGSLIEQSPLRELLPTINLGEMSPKKSGDLGKKVYAALVNKTMADMGSEANTVDGFHKAMSLANRRIQIFAESQIEPGSAKFEPNKIGLMTGRGLMALLNSVRNSGGQAEPQAAARTDVDIQALNEMLDREAPREDFEAWLREQLRPAMGERRVVNENGRTAEFTLDNIVKAMTRKVRDAEGFNYGLGNARSKGATKFKSLAQIQGRRDQIVSKEAFEAARKEIDAEFNALSEAVAPFRQRPQDSASELLAEAIGNSYGGTGMDKALQAAALEGVPADLQKRISEFAGALVGAPTEYFEAKPQRAVGLDEFRGAVIPSNAAPDVRKALADLGLKAMEYRKGDNADRARAVREMSSALDADGGDVLFSKSGASEGKAQDVDLARVTAVADAIRSKWANSPPVVVVADMADPQVPDAVREADHLQRSQGAAGAIEGFWHDGQVYLVSSALPSEADITRVLAHEVLGHHGLRGVFGDALDGLLDRMARTLPDRIAEKAQQYGLDVADQAQRREAAEELLAELAQTRPSSTWVQKAVAAVREFLRGLGMNLKLTDADIVAQYLVPARGWVERGGAGRARGSSVMSKRTDDAVQILPAIIGNPLAASNTHPRYSEAKAGDPAAALELARDLVNDGMVAEVRALIGDRKPIVVPVVSVEATGRNKIPLMTAEVLAHHLDLETATDIAQADSPNRTAMDGLDRLLSAPEFDGPVTRGADYLLVDDTLTQGGAFASLASHIRAGGGNVVGSVALTGKRYSATMNLSPDLLSKVRERFQDVEPAFRAATGYGFDALTESEARYIASFKPADAVRTRFAEAGRKAGERLGQEAARQEVDGPRFSRTDGAMPDSAAAKSISDLQAKLKKAEAKFAQLQGSKASAAEWDAATAEAASYRRELAALTGDDYGQQRAKKIRPTDEELGAEYMHPSEVPASVMSWLQANNQILTTDATDAVRWARIVGTRRDDRYPNGDVTIYRAVHGDEIRPGDWVTTDRKYAEDHAKRYLGRGAQVIEMTVDGSDVLQSPTGNAEEAIYAPLDLSGPHRPTAAARGTADIRFSRASPPARDPTTESALRKAGLVKPGGIKEKLKGYFDAAMQLVRDRGELGDAFVQGALDQFHGINRAVKREVGNLPAEQDPYVAARLANSGTSSVMRGLLLHGQAQWAANGQHLEKIDGTRGLLDVLGELGPDLNDWFGWMIGNRAASLMAEGRENNFTGAEIAALQALGAGKEEKFRAVSREYAAFKGSVLDVAEKAGLIDGEARKVWDKADYIPFYRQMDNAGSLNATGKKGLAGQSSGIRTLRGGTEALNDPMENVIMNFSRLIDASLKNNALRRTVDILGSAASETIEKIGYDNTQVSVPAAQVKKMLLDAGMSPQVMSALPASTFTGMAKLWTIAPPTDPDVIRIMRNGKPEFYRVHDPLLLRAATSFIPFNFPGLGVMRAFKRVLTGAVTATPEFMMRNFIRDAVASAIISRDDFSLSRTIAGIGKSWREDGAAEAMLFAGASFQSGDVNAADPTGTAAAMRRALRQRGMDATAVNSFMGTVMDGTAKAWELYRKAGEAIENSSREAVYEAAQKSGKSATAAAFEAKDLMDFSLRGSAPVYQLFADVLPFFNARVQGLYRLGRADPKRVARYGMLMMAASLALAAVNSGNDEYEKLPDFDKDTFWHVWIGGKHFRLPKPFELGAAFATIPERVMRYAIGADSGKKAATRIWENVRDQLAFDFVPQTFRPILNIYANKDSFRGSPIENQADEGKRPTERYSASTSATAKVITDAIEPVANEIGLSPKRLEYMVSGYLGTVGMYALGLSDMAVRSLQDEAPRPALRADDIPVVKAFYRVDPGRGSVFENDLFEMRKHFGELQKSVKALEREGELEKAGELRTRYAKELAAGEVLDRGSKFMTAMTKQRDTIYRSRTMTPEQKRIALDQLSVQKSDLAKMLMENPAVKPLR